ncbi:MAG: tetratricopeptide repeat protein [Deltaproteobacteria bacterium]|nr:tetratricopeptide repeat protein [Deltaproteobacteria bacterium]
MAYKKKGDLRSARKYYTKALEIDPNNSIAFNNLGMLAAAENNPIAATYLLEKAITADPKNPDPYLNLAYILEKTGNKAQALKYFAMYLNFSTVNSKVSSKVSPNVSLMTKTLLYKRIRALEKTP